ncbi:hypothetical protein [Aliidiomarina soli]|uniref:Uncharacterized protein n=1 Tax=Aliidiomarina soli TaxID=1928574 RepID=A0A432WLE5_9GAMM|nr:hypothetical protein [Aliidiomarina soli]RUO34595.1 hypothetical protein CWE14_00925 [Aliidiomarina soli]
MNQRGQAMTELVVAMPVLVMLLFWGMPRLWQALEQRSMAQQLANLALAQAEERNAMALPAMDMAYWNDELDLWLNWRKWMVLYNRNEYPFATATKPFELMARYESSLGMANDNLWDVEIADVGYSQWVRYLRLRDDWSPRKLDDLRRRPALLTGSNLLDNYWLRTLQSGLSMLPLARELGPQQLVPGHVDVDVVPADALCHRDIGAPCVTEPGERLWPR